MFCKSLWTNLISGRNNYIWTYFKMLHILLCTYIIYIFLKGFSSRRDNCQSIYLPRNSPDTLRTQIFYRSLWINSTSGRNNYVWTYIKILRTSLHTFISESFCFQERQLRVCIFNEKLPWHIRNSNTAAFAICCTA